MDKDLRIEYLKAKFYNLDISNYIQHTCLSLKTGNYIVVRPIQISLDTPEFSAYMVFYNKWGYCIRGKFSHIDLVEGVLSLVMFGFRDTWSIPINIISNLETLTSYLFSNEVVRTQIDNNNSYQMRFF